MELVRRLALEGLLTEEELSAVVARRATFGEPAPVALVALRLASVDAITTQLERLGFARAKALEPGPLAKTLPKGMLRALWVLPLNDGPRGAVVAMADPTDRHAVRELEYHLRRPFDPQAAPLDALREVLLQVDPPPRVAQPHARDEQARRSEPHEAGASPRGARAQSQAPAEKPGPTRAPSGAHAIPREGLAFALRDPVRRATPAYGQAQLRSGEPHARSMGLGDALPRARALEPVSLALGAWEPVSRELPVETQKPAQNPTRRNSSVRVPAMAPIPREALYALAELSTATDRDTIARAAARGMTTEAERAAFFVLKRGVVQGWEGAAPDGAGSAGLSREALRNLWIPVTSPSVFRVVNESRTMFLGALSESTADSILAAALGGRPERVLVAPIEVRRHVVAFLYADSLRDADEARRRMNELVEACSDALARWLALRAAGR